jgi:hypothetical protein
VECDEKESELVGQVNVGAFDQQAPQQAYAPSMQQAAYPTTTTTTTTSYSSSSYYYGSGYYNGTTTTANAFADRLLSFHLVKL